MQTGRGRACGEQLHPPLGYRGQMLTDLVEGRLGNLAQEPLVLPLREQARQLPKGMHVRDDRLAPERSPELVGEGQCLDRALRTVDANDDRAALVWLAHG
jgi:hypothetical protein